MKIIGDYPKDIIRIHTGFYSLDMAFTNDLGEIGIPVGHGYEIFGGEGIGKSTFVFSLAGIIASIQKKDITICDFEGFDRRRLVKLLETVSFDGNVNLVRKKEDEEQLMEMLKFLAKPEYAVGIIDSVGSISPISESEGDLGESNMGRRGFLMAQVSRKGLKILRDNPGEKTLILINHWYPTLGKQNYDTPGGKVLKYLVANRILLRNKEDFADGSSVLEGEIRKNRWGYEGRKFYAFILATKGLSKEMTAVWDCIMLDIAERRQGGTIAINNEKLGSLASLAKKAKAGDVEIFNKFYEALNEHSSSHNKSNNSDNSSDLDNNEVQDSASNGT